METHHLDDRSLYTLLWKEWLDHPTADIPPEAETNTNLIVSEFAAGGMTAEEIWLRYYAREDDQELWLSTNLILFFPRMKPRPMDRDRFLPTPPIPPEAHAGWLPGDDGPAEDPEPDPLGLAKLTGKSRRPKPAPRPMTLRRLNSTDPLWKRNSGAAEPENWTPPAQQLAEQNIPLLPPAEITDETLVPILWELLHNLALRGFYVLHSDHLSDRELYAELWERGLRDPAYLPGRNPRGGWFHDFLGQLGRRRHAVMAALLRQRQRARPACPGMAQGHSPVQRKAGRQS